MKVLFTGSRNLNGEGLNAAFATLFKLQRVYKDDLHIIVGDATGLDSQVIVWCEYLEISIEVHGAYNKVKHLTFSGKNIAHSCTYPERDRIMAGLAEKCFAFWDGKSRGTQITFKACQAQRIETIVKVFKSESDK